MSIGTNRQILLKRRPQGLPKNQDFEFVETAVPSLNSGEILVKTLILSVDPYMRGRMNDQKSYVPPYKLGEPIAGGALGEVIESKHPDFRAGDVVLAGYGWQTIVVLDGSAARKINLPETVPISTALHVLGMTGLTAYFGLIDIGRVKAGETVVVSGAAGAVGMVVGQIAKIKGARAVGIAGSNEKCEYLVRSLGFDAAVNYKESEFVSNLNLACADGVDVYFDNVGGPVSDAVLSFINRGARIPVCGQISLYNLETVDTGPRVQGLLLVNSALMQGFTVGNYSSRFSEGIQELAAWVQDGTLKYRETVVEGFDNTIEAFLGLFRGQNTGKLLVKVV